MAQIDLVLGGARSGKSLFAENLVLKTGLKATYIATAQAFDEEMQTRISLHQKRRSDFWRIVECPIELCSAIENYNDQKNIILIDCLTLWLSNLMLGDYNVEIYFDCLLKYFENNQAHIVFVANEVGLGIVPDNKLARQFRDFSGQLNQKIAHHADNVYFIAAGLPMQLKGSIKG